MTQFLEQIMLLAIAVVSNALSAMAGGGAGLLQLPALIFLGLPFPIALTTHKIATVALGAGASFKHWRAGNIEWQPALLMLSVGIPAVILGANTILNIPANIAQTALGVLTIALGVYSIFKKALALLSPAQWTWLPALVVGSLLGGYIGAHVGIKYGNLLIKRVFEIITILVGIALILKT